MSQASEPKNPPKDTLRDILELYASKADELIVGARNRRQTNLHLDRAEAIRSARESLKAGQAGEFVRFAASRQALPITRRVARHTEAINHLERLSDATRLKMCNAFAKALEAERRADQRLIDRGELFRENGACTLLDHKVATLKKIQSGIGAGKAL